MADMEQMFLRQDRWQKERRLLPWPEKIRLAEAIRESLLQFRRARGTRIGTSSGSKKT